MDGILGTVMDQLGSGGLGALGEKLGLGQDQTEGAVKTAVNVLTGAMAQNASEKTGAQALDDALAADHDGSIFENVSGFIGDFMSGPGQGILGHVLGGQQAPVEKEIAEKSGLSLDKVLPLLVAVAPLVMGALGKLKKDNDLDASQVATTLQTERQKAEQEDDGLLGSVFGMLGGLGGGGSAQSATQEQSGGGLLGMLGGLFKKKGS